MGEMQVSEVYISIKLFKKEKNSSSGIYT